MCERIRSAFTLSTAYATVRAKPDRGRREVWEQDGVEGEKKRELEMRET